MKILFTSRYDSSNTYLKEIVDGLFPHCQVLCSADAFWYSNLRFDIIHIQWSEELFYWKPCVENDLQKLNERIQFWQSNGAKIVVTRHNELPHRKHILDTQLYDLVYKNCNAVIHLGEYSKETLSSPQIKNVVIEHPLYFSQFKEIDGKTAKIKVGLPEDSILFLSFGSIRKKEEERQVIKAFKQARFDKKHYLFVAKSLTAQNKPSFKEKPFKRFLYEINRLRLRHSNILLMKKISREKLSYFLSAADVLISPRIDSLNSGVVYMGYTFDKIVIAPAIGNIKETMKANDYPVFEPLNTASIVLSMKEALSKKGNEKHKKYPDNKQIAEQHYFLYKELCNE